MERNRPVTIFAVIMIALMCVLGVFASFTASPEHPIKAALLTLAVILGGLAAISAIHFLMFVPLFTILMKLWGKNRRHEDAEPQAGGYRR
jgi:hypothetical protein